MFEVQLKQNCKVSMYKRCQEVDKPKSHHLYLVLKLISFENVKVRRKIGTIIYRILKSLLKRTKMYLLNLLENLSLMQQNQIYTQKVLVRVVIDDTKKLRNHQTRKSNQRHKIFLQSRKSQLEIQKDQEFEVPMNKVWQVQQLH